MEQVVLYVLVVGTSLVSHVNAVGGSYSDVYVPHIEERTVWGEMVLGHTTDLWYVTPEEKVHIENLEVAKMYFEHSPVEHEQRAKSLADFASTSGPVPVRKNCSDFDQDCKSEKDYRLTNARLRFFGDQLSFGNINISCDRPLVYMADLKAEMMFGDSDEHMRGDPFEGSNVVVYTASVRSYKKEIDKSGVKRSVEIFPFHSIEGDQLRSHEARVMDSEVCRLLMGSFHPEGKRCVAVAITNLPQVSASSSGAKPFKVDLDFAVLYDLLEGSPYPAWLPYVMQEEENCPERGLRNLSSVSQFLTGLSKLPSESASEPLAALAPLGNLIDILSAVSGSRCINGNTGGGGFLP